MNDGRADDVRRFRVLELLLHKHGGLELHREGAAFTLYASYAGEEIGRGASFGEAIDDATKEIP
jgi:hypothetical protein